MQQIFIKNPTEVEFSHEYDLIRGLESNSITLFRSINGDWANKHKGKQAVVLEDNGEGVDIKGDFRTISLDYTELMEVLIVLAAYNEEIIEFRESKIIKII